MKHTVECDAASARSDAAIAEYVRLWPDYCKPCRGTGGHGHSYDPSPAGISLSPGRMYDWEKCSECVCKCICPRCGTGSLVDYGTDHDEDSTDDIRCSDCGWPWKTKGAPEPYDGCACWELDESTDVG